MESERISQPVRELQSMLRLVESSQGQHLPVIADGIYGSQTERAVKSFQRSHGLPVTGVADHATWERLVQEADRSRESRMEAAPVRIVLQPDQVIRPGERNRHLYMLQGMLKALAERYSNLPQVDVSGVNDEKTQAAVKALKSCTDCKADGIIDRHFYAQLAGLYRSAVGDGSVQ